MRGTRIYPDEPSGPFPTPPTSFEDREGRSIDIVFFDGDDEDEFEALTRMYVLFDPADRAQGIPPTGESRIRDWLEPLLGYSVNVVAKHQDEIVGHATLVPDAEDPASIDDPGDVEWELAIFVLQAYQSAGIGTQLLERLLGKAAEDGIRQVWLTVERWNGPAITLYERVGFELCGAESFEQEMAIVLTPDGE